MRRSAWKLKVIGLLTLVFCLLSGVFLSNSAKAGDLGVKVRIDRTSISKTTGGMICATPETSGTENSIQIVFPTGFNVNSNPSNWTITTSNLPSGSIALPGIGTATAVSGQTVTFPSNNLSVGTEYCFNFASSNTLTTPSSTGSYTGILRTVNSSNQVIDYHPFTVTIVANDGISVTATVAANPTDYNALLQLTSPSNNGYLTEGTVITYQLTYGSTLPYSSDITVEAQWNLGTINGASVPSEDLLDYVVGSATNGYNSTPPVIDSTNKKIVWDIPNFPGNTNNQTVTFRLLVKNTSTTTSSVNFSVDGRVIGTGTQTADSTVISRYLRSSYITPTPTPTCSPGHCPTPTPNPSGTPTPTPTSTPIYKQTIQEVQVRTVGSTDASIYISTKNPTTARIDIGTDFKNLKSIGYSNVPSKQHLIPLRNLKPNTRYYFKVIVTENGVSTSSDFYKLTTSIASEPILISPQTFILTTGDLILRDYLSSNSGIIIPQKTPFSFKFNVNDYNKIKSIKAFTRNANVLGISSANIIETSSNTVPVIEIQPGEYVGKLSVATPGRYKLILQIQDYNGNISEQIISDINVVSPMQVIDQFTKRGIESVKITLYLYNPRLKTYNLITSDFSSIKNPNYSEPDGYVWTVLPAGRYKAELKILGFKEKTIEFTIDPKKKEGYPVITLTPLPFNFVTLMQSYLETAEDIFHTLGQTAGTLSASFRLFQFLEFLLLIFLAFLVTVILSKRLAVPVFLIPSFALYHALLPFRKNPDAFLVHGNIGSTGSDEAISGALIYVSTKSGRVLSHTKSNNYGEFFLKIHEATDLRITVTKKGFSGTTFIVKKEKLNERIKIQIAQTGKLPGLSLNNIKWYIGYLLNTFFEALLILFLVLVILFIGQFGLIKVLPLLIVSIMDILLWAENMRAARR